MHPAPHSSPGSDANGASAAETAKTSGHEMQVTTAPHGHVLTNVNVWSPDSRQIVYDVRSDPDGATFDGDRIETVDVNTGDVRVLYQSASGAHCGVATYHPAEPKVVFILGPEHPTPDFSYAAARRQGVIVDASRPGVASNLDARDLTPPFTPGALRGGSHVHVFSPDGQLVAFTYQDHLLAQFAAPGPRHDVDQRNVGVSLIGRPVRVRRDHPRSHDGSAFSVLVTRTVASPVRGSDEISRAFEDAWVGTNGYLRADGGRQKRAIAFQGEVVTGDGRTISEVFIVDLPDHLTAPGDGPLAGTDTRRPAPPRGTVQRRLTYTADRRHPGIGGPRHWLRSSPDGSRIAYLARDDDGVVQLWTVSPNGGPPVQVTRGANGIASAFTWSPDGRRVAHVMDNSVFVTDVDTGRGTRLTPRTNDATAPRAEACVFSPDGRRVTFVRRVASDAGMFNQIFVVDSPG